MELFKKSKQFLFTTVISLALLACGKPVSDSKKGKDPGPRNDQDERAPFPSERIADLIKSLDFECSLDDCPEYITKILILNDNEIKHCAGVLVNQNSVLTLASCIPRALRIKGFDCSENIFAVFPETKNKAKSHAICKNILEMDSNINYLEPAMWKGDYLLFSLVDNQTRKAARPALNSGLQNNSLVDLWSIDQLDTQRSRVVRSKCRVLQNTYLNPFVDSEFSPMSVVTDCSASTGNGGAALINSSGELVGSLSREMSDSIYDYLKNNDIMHGQIGKYYHVSNASCLPFFHGGQTSPHCDQQTSLSQLDLLRGKIIAGNGIHTSEMKAVERYVEGHNSYFTYDVSFENSRSKVKYEMKLNRPKCIFDSKAWIGEFRGWRGIYTYGKRNITLPSYEFITKLGRNLRPLSIKRDTTPKIFTVEFNPFNAHVKGFTDVRLTFLDVNGKEVEENHLNVTATCP